jgi:hypothetical protein
MRAVLCALPLLLCACSTTKSAGPPAEVADQIVLAIESDQDARAGDLFDRATSDDQDSMYPRLYQAAQSRYEAGDNTGAIELLRFMVENYLDAMSVRQALLYALFVERGTVASAAPGWTEECDRTLAQLRSSASSLPPWVDLCEAQLRADQGRTEDARRAFASFLQGWDGDPPELAVYVDDLERYLNTH